MDFATQNRIDQIVAREIQKIRETKGKEYASEEDTLADFKEVAEEAGITPLQCWATYVKKHERAIDTFIREGAVKSEAIEGRILDVIVYHHLLLGLIAEHPEHSGFLFGSSPFRDADVAADIAEARDDVVNRRLGGQTQVPLAHQGPQRGSDVAIAQPGGGTRIEPGPPLDASVPFPHGDVEAE